MTRDMKSRLVKKHLMRFKYLNSFIIQIPLLYLKLVQLITRIPVNGDLFNYVISYKQSGEKGFM